MRPPSLWGLYSETGRLVAKTTAADEKAAWARFRKQRLPGVKVRRL